MSNFLMVIPVGWTEMVTGHQFVIDQTEVALFDLISYGGQTTIEGILQDMGEIPPAATLAEFRMFRDGETYRVWYRIG